MKIKHLAWIVFLILGLSLSMVISCGDDDDDDDDSSGGSCYCYCAGTGCEVTGLNNDSISTESACEQWCEDECAAKGCPLKNSWLTGPEDDDPELSE